MAGTTGYNNKRYVSGVSLLDYREIYPKVFDISNDTDLLDIMDMMGRTVPTAMAEYNNFVDDELYTILDTTGGTVTGTGTATVTAVLTAATSGYARVSDLLRFPNGKVGRITSVTSDGTNDTITVKTDTGVLTLVAGGLLAPFGNAQGEGSGSPTARRWSQTPYTNLIQIFKDKAVITDIQKASRVETTYNGQPYWSYKAFGKSLLSFRTQIAATFLLGRLSTTKFSTASPVAAGTDAAGNPVQTTMGLDQYVTTYGVVDTLTTPGTVIMADQKSLVTQLIAAKGASKYFVFGSAAAKMEYDSWLMNLGSSNVQPSMRYELNGKKLDFDVQSFTLGNVTFNWATLGAFNHKLIQNTDIAKNAYFVPEENVKTADGDMIPSMRVRTMNPGAGATGPNSTQNSTSNGTYREDLIGKYAPGGANSETSELAAHYEAHMGLECLGVSKFAKQTVLA